MTQEDHPTATDYRNRAERAEAELAEVRAEVRDMLDNLRHETNAAWGLLEAAHNLLRSCRDFIKNGARYSLQDFDLRQQIDTALNGGKHD